MEAMLLNISDSSVWLFDGVTDGFWRRRIKDTKHKAANIHKQQQDILGHLSEKQQREAEAREQLERQWQENQQLKQQHERTK